MHFNNKVTDVTESTVSNKMTKAKLITVKPSEEKALTTIIETSKAKTFPKNRTKNDTGNIITKVNKTYYKPELSSTEKIVKETSLPDHVIDSGTISNVVITHTTKILKVVHINELGDPVEPPADVARTKDLHSFQLKFANQEVYISPSLTSNNNGINPLKLKTFPSN